SYIIFILITQLGIGPIWTFPSYNTEGIMDFFYAILYGGVAASFGWIFIALVKGIKFFVDIWNARIFIKMGIGGLILEFIYYFYPITRYFGHHELNLLMDSPNALT